MFISHIRNSFYSNSGIFFWCDALLPAKYDTFLRTPFAAFAQLSDPASRHVLWKMKDEDQVKKVYNGISLKRRDLVERKFYA